MSTVFTYDPTGFALTVAQDPEVGNESSRDLQLALFSTAAGKPRALRRKSELLRLSLSFADLCGQAAADLEHFHSQVVEESLREFRLQMGAFIAAPIACGETIGGSAVVCGQNLSELDETLPEAPMVCGKFYHGNRTITLPRCRFEQGSFRKRANARGGDPSQRNGHEISFSILCDWEG